MKTGLVTFYHIHHYGALLQAYATERAVEALGGECEIVDYYVNQNNALFRAPTGLGSAITAEVAEAPACDVRSGLRTEPGTDQAGRRGRCA